MLPPADAVVGLSKQLRVQICFAKAKAFGIKRVVHRIEIPYAELVGMRTTISWVVD